MIKIECPEYPVLAGQYCSFRQKSSRLFPSPSVAFTPAMQAGHLT
jgi:hypothetical protein